MNSMNMRSGFRPVRRSHEFASSDSQRESEPRDSVGHSASVKNYAKNEKENKKIFVDAEEMKAKIREQTLKPVYNVAVYYHTTGIWQKIARHSGFEQLTLGVIAFNALWISIDTDLNEATVITQAEPVFQCAEHFFCLYFSFEWVVRFMSFKRKRDGLRDSWFIFDTILVGMMVLETWAMCFIMLAAGPSGGSSIMGNAGMLRMARLLRLSRMARMARLFRAMPQLLIVIKALIASLSSCIFVFALLIVITYVFGIALRQLTAGYAVGEEFFHNVPKAMYTLWVDGTILDSPHAVSSELWNAHPTFPFVFWLFSGLSALLIMNMLIGILCEVVTAVSGAEKERFNAEYVKSKLQEIIRDSGLDKNGDGQISKAELSCLLEIPRAYEALSDVGVDVFMLVDNIDYIFSRGPDDEEEEEADLTFEEFMTLVLELRGSNTVTVNDIVDLKKYIKRANTILRDELKVARHTLTAGLSGSFGGEGGSARTKSFKRTESSSGASGDASTVAVETLREEFKSIIEQSLLPELSKVCTARQQEMHEELSDLITQLRRGVAAPHFPHDDVNTEIVFTESASPCMMPKYSDVRLASGGGVSSKAAKGPSNEVQTSRNLSPSRIGYVKTKEERGQSSVGSRAGCERGSRKEEKPDAPFS